MKKLLFALVVIIASASCNDSGSSGQGVADTTGSNTGYIENVNGNLPDTSNAISIGSDQQDTLKTTPMDSIRR